MNKNSMISLVFVGTSEFSVQCLKFLLELDVQVKAVITRPDRPHSRGLKQKGSPVRLFSEARGLTLWTPETFTSSFIQKTAEQKCDLALVCGYGRMIPVSFFQCFSKGAVNIHPSLLPRWRGAAPIERALMAGDTKTGVCLQIMVKEMDAGDIIGRKEFAIKGDDTALEIYQRAEQATRELLQSDLIPYAKGHVQPVPQEGKVTFAKRLGDRRTGRGSGYEFLKRDPSNGSARSPFEFFSQRSLFPPEEPVGHDP